MYSIKKIDGKECNTAKGVSIATEFNKFKDVLFNYLVLYYFFCKSRFTFFISVGGFFFIKLS